MAAVLMWVAATALAGQTPGTAAGRLVWTFDLSGQPAGETHLWVPYPVSDARQRVTDVRIAGDYDHAEVLTDRTYSTPMLHAFWPEGVRPRRLTFSFRVERDAGRRGDLPPLDASDAPWNPKDFGLWLRPSRLVATGGVVEETARKIVAGKDTVLEKARAVYEWVCRNTYRNPDTRGCGAGDVCRLLTEDPGGKCGDISSVFVALARAAGVPARHVLGIRLGKEDGQEVTTWQHCWAEFYLPGYGWVLVDPADVRKMMLKRGLGRTDPVPEDLMEFYWDGADPFRVKLSVGRDLVLNPPQKARPVNYLMYPYAEVAGKPLDWLDPEGFRYEIRYEAR